MSPCHLVTFPLPLPLTSSSTVAECVAAYVDNSSYDTDGSAAMCRLFIQAVRVLLIKIPKRVQHGGQGADGFEIDPEVLRAELTAAQAWLSANDATMADAAGGGGVIFPDFSDFRR